MNKNSDIVYKHKHLPLEPPNHITKISISGRPPCNKTRFYYTYTLPNLSFSSQTTQLADIFQKLSRHHAHLITSWTPQKAILNLRMRESYSKSSNGRILLKLWRHETLIMQMLVIIKWKNVMIGKKSMVLPIYFMTSS